MTTDQIEHTPINYGVVVFDNYGGDYSVHVVDEQRWNQIQSLPFSGQAYCQAVGWLTSDLREETDPPNDAPVRVGSCLKEYFCQHYVIEPTDVIGAMLGILFL
jgi:hypothetical protein